MLKHNSNQEKFLGSIDLAEKELEAGYKVITEEIIKKGHESLNPQQVLYLLRMPENGCSLASNDHYHKSNPFYTVKKLGEQGYVTFKRHPGGRVKKVVLTTRGLAVREQFAAAKL